MSEPTQPPSDQKPAPTKVNYKSTAFFLLGAGLIIVLYIFLEYGQLADFEAGNVESIRLNIVEKILYELMGLNGMMIFLGILAALCFSLSIFLGIKHSRSKKIPSNPS